MGGIRYQSKGAVSLMRYACPLTEMGYLLPWATTFVKQVQSLRQVGQEPRSYGSWTTTSPGRVGTSWSSGQVTFDFPTPAMITESERDAMLPILQMEVRDAKGNQIKTRLSKAGDWSWCSIVAAPLTKELVYHSGIKEDLFKGMPTRQYKATGFLQSLVKGSHATGQIHWPEGVNSHSVIGVSVSIWGEGVPDPAVRTTERKELSTWNAVGAQTEFIPGIAKTGMPWIAIITVDNTWTE